MDQADAERAINGALFMHATRMLGNDVLRGLTSPMGDLMNHEGVVLRDEEKFGPNPVKITGEFILGNLGGGFGGSINEDEEDFIGYKLKPVKEEEESDDPVVDADFSKTIAVVPGAFKPPHKGHLDMVRSYANMADEVVVLISRPTKSGRKLPNGREVTAEDSLKIWNVLTTGMPNVRVEISTHASPINAAYEYVGDEGPLNVGDKVILGCSNKGGDCKRWAGAEKYIKQGVELVPVTGVEPTARVNGEPYSATDFRNALGKALDNRDEIAEFVGEENVAEILHILDLENNIDEQSGAGGAGAAISGPSGPLASGSVKRRRPAKKRATTTNNENLNLVNEVMRLIMERGILS